MRLWMKRLKMGPSSRVKHFEIVQHPRLSVQALKWITGEVMTKLYADCIYIGRVLDPMECDVILRCWHRPVLGQACGSAYRHISYLVIHDGGSWAEIPEYSSAPSEW